MRCRDHFHPQILGLLLEQFLLPNLFELCLLFSLLLSLNLLPVLFLLLRLLLLLELEFSLTLLFVPLLQKFSLLLALLGALLHDLDLPGFLVDFEGLCWCLFCALFRWVSCRLLLLRPEIRQSCRDLDLYDGRLSAIVSFILLDSDVRVGSVLIR